MLVYFVIDLPFYEYFIFDAWWPFHILKFQTVLSETDLYASEQNGEGDNYDDNESVHSTDTNSTQDSEFINPKGVRFTQQSNEGMHRKKMI